MIAYLLTCWLVDLLAPILKESKIIRLSKYILRNTLNRTLKWDKRIPGIINSLSLKTFKISKIFSVQNFQLESPGSFLPGSGEKFVQSAMRKICFTLNRDAEK